jgi:hypothetical protein
MSRNKSTKGKLFGKNSQMQLTPYQEVVNVAAYSLAKENPALISDRGQLMNLAEKKVRDDGLNNFKKGKSRTKSIEIEETDQSKSQKKTSHIERQDFVP